MWATTVETNSSSLNGSRSSDPRRCGKLFRLQFTLRFLVGFTIFCSLAFWCLWYGWPAWRDYWRVETLLGELSDPDSGTREQAARRLGQVGAKARRAVPALIVAMQDEKWGVQKQAELALENLGGVAIPDLIEALGHDEERVRAWCTEALGNIGPSAQAAVPRMMVALRNDQSELVRKDSAYAVGKIDTQAASLAMLTEAVQHDQAPKVRGEAAEAIAKIDRKARHIDVLVEALRDDEDETVRTCAARALYLLGPRASPVVPALTAALEDPSHRVRAVATTALSNAGPKAKSAVPTLRRLLTNPDHNVRLNVAIVLWWLEWDGEEIDPALTELLDVSRDPSRVTAPAIRIETVELLEQIGPAARGAVPALNKLLEETLDPYLQDAIRQALKKILEGPSELETSKGR